MAEQTKISWTLATENFWMGCTKVSEGCQHCYAEPIVNRIAPPFNELKRTSDKTFYAPLSWKEPMFIFANSISDFFHPDADPWRGDAWSVIRRASWHVWQILTKRPALVRERLPSDWGRGWDNVWLGVSVENQRAADQRIPLLQAIPASIRFLSIEPLLGEIDLSNHLLDGIGWTVVGGESGPHYRSMNIAWAKKIRDLCIAKNVPFWFKQQSDPRPEMNPYLDGKEWRQRPPALVKKTRLEDFHA